MLNRTQTVEMTTEELCLAIVANMPFYKVLKTSINSLAEIKMIGEALDKNHHIVSVKITLTHEIPTKDFYECEKARDRILAKLELRKAHVPGLFGGRHLENLDGESAVRNYLSEPAPRGQTDDLPPPMPKH